MTFPSNPLQARFLLACAAALAHGCSQPVATEMLGDDTAGKADRAGDATCDAYVEWLVYEYAPVDCEEGPSCAGRAPVEARPPCGPEGADAAHLSWRNAYLKHVQAPWLSRWNQAQADFIWRGDVEQGQINPWFSDQDRFAAEAAFTEDERAAHAALLAVQPTPTDAGSYHFVWLEPYLTVLSQLAFPSTPDLHSHSVPTGRDVCGDPHLDAPPCPWEPSLFLNAGEAEALDLLAEARPTPTEDGAYEEWLGHYTGYLGRGANLDLLGFEFPLRSEQGLAPYEEAFFARLRSVAPRAVGERDSDGWMGKYLVFVQTARLELADERLRLSMVEEVRPDVLVGAPAYESWLGVDLVGLGLAQTEDAELRGRLLEHKPCARTDEELVRFDEAYRLYRDLAGEDPAAAPQVCPK